MTRSNPLVAVQDCLLVIMSNASVPVQDSLVTMNNVGVTVYVTLITMTQCQKCRPMLFIFKIAIEMLGI